jgi:hypothetical protein
MYASPHVSDKALRDFAYRVLMSEMDLLKARNPGTTPLEIKFFVDSLTSDQLSEIYYMFYNTGMVQ